MVRLRLVRLGHTGADLAVAGTVRPGGFLNVLTRHAGARAPDGNRVQGPALIDAMDGPTSEALSRGP
jgi:hypothetical protein